MRNLRARAIQITFAFLILVLSFLYYSNSASFEDLRSQLQTTEPSLRIEALLQITLPYEAPFFPLLLNTLEDPDPIVAHTAFQILQKSSPAEILPFLQTAFNQKSPILRQKIIQLLAHFGYSAKPILPFLLQVYSENEIVVQIEILAQITKIAPTSPEVFVLLKNALQQESPLLRQQALTTLASLPPTLDLSFEPYFILALRDPLPEIRILAITLLDQMACYTALPTLLLCLKDSQFGVRESAILAIIHLGKTHLEILPSLLNTAQNCDPSSREAFLKVFYGIGKEAIITLPFVLQCLQDSDEWVQLHATRCAGVFQAVVTVPYLIPFLKNPSLPIFPEALKALGAIRHPQPIPDLLRLLQNIPKEHRSLLSWTLAQMPPKNIFPLLKPLLQETKVYLRCQALWILGELNDPIGIFALSLALNDEDYLVRREAIRALGKLGEKAKGLEVDLQKALTDIDEEVRNEAKCILSKFQEKDPVKK